MLSAALASSAFALGSVTLAWDASPDNNVAGYRLFYGAGSGVYNKAVDVGNQTRATIPQLVEGGTYYIVVTAYNSSAIQSTPSNEIGVTVAPNAPPTVNLTSPQSGSSFSGGSPVQFTANASDSDGSISRVEYYAGYTQVGSAFRAPYSASWSKAAGGSYVLTAIAYDNSGSAVRSSEVPITIAAAPAATPAPGPASGAVASTVTVSALTRSVRAGGTGAFYFARSGDASKSLVINYSLSGSAAAGRDYSAPSPAGQAVIPAGSGSATVYFSVPSTFTGSKRTVTATLANGTGYSASWRYYRATATLSAPKSRHR